MKSVCAQGAWRCINTKTLNVLNNDSGSQCCYSCWSLSGEEEEEDDGACPGHAGHNDCSVGRWRDENGRFASNPNNQCCTTRLRDTKPCQCMLISKVTTNQFVDSVLFAKFHNRVSTCSAEAMISNHDSIPMVQICTWWHLMS